MLKISSVLLQTHSSMQPPAFRTFVHKVPCMPFAATLAQGFEDFDFFFLALALQPCRRLNPPAMPVVIAASSQPAPSPIIQSFVDRFATIFARAELILLILLLFGQLMIEEEGEK